MKVAEMDNIAEIICSLPDLHEEKALASLLLRPVSQYTKDPSYQRYSITGSIDARGIHQLLYIQ